jgi:hypothetical protein
MKYLKRVATAKALKSVPTWKYGLLMLGSAAWTYGLVEQLYSSAAMMKYLLLSLLMAAVAVL